MSVPLAHTVAEAASVCGVSPDVIRQAIKRGDIPVKYPTSRPVILRADLEAWLAAAPTERTS